MLLGQVLWGQGHAPHKGWMLQDLLWQPVNVCVADILNSLGKVSKTSRSLLDIISKARCLSNMCH